MSDKDKDKDKDKGLPTGYFTLDLDKIPNGNHYPTEVYEFSERMRRWRARSAQSTLLIG